MSGLLARVLIAARRARVRAARPRVDREALIREHAPGRSWLDVGCMWSVHGRYAFEAEAAGATAVTGIDVMAATPQFEAERARRGSAVAFRVADLHDAALAEAIGVHDVVWCTGVLYHVPDPLGALRRLGALTGERLLLGTETLPEVPGVPGACVFYPGLGDHQRRAYAAAPGGSALGVTAPYDPAQGYGNWFWGITPSALRAMAAAAGFAVERELEEGFFRLLVLRRDGRA